MTIATMTQHPDDVWHSGEVVAAEVTNDCGMPLTMDWSLVYQSTNPRMTDAVPNVMMNGSTRSSVTRKPLMPPTKAPSATPNRMPSHMFQPWLAYIEAVITDARPADVADGQVEVARDHRHAGCPASAPR